MDQNTARLAVLIDADNVSASVIEGLFSEITKIGDATVKRIYGDFTSTRSSQWKDTLNTYAIKPMQQFAYTTGKNTTDSSLIIDAMDLLHTSRFDGFCLVSSDSDFTGLAVRIREEGLQVYGFGERKTPDAFRNACNKFTFMEVLRNATAATDPETVAVTASASSKQSKAKSSAKTTNKPKEKMPLELIKTAIENSRDDSGYARLGAVGNNLVRLKPDFDVRLYGCSNTTLNALLRSRPDVFEMNGEGKTLSVRLKS